MSGIVRHRASPGARAWRVWRGWRRSRPFWGGLFVLLGGVEILLTVWAPLGVVLHVGMQNFIGYLVPYVIILLGLLLWFNPAQRIFYSLIAMLCALGSWLTSNMGGFVFGLLLTLVGAALAFAWAPVADAPGGDLAPRSRRRRRHLRNRKPIAAGADPFGAGCETFYYGTDIADAPTSVVACQLRPFGVSGLSRYV